MQFNIGSIRLRERLKVFDSLGVTLPAVATEPEQHARLRVRRVGIQRALKGIDRCLEVPLLEFREAEVETYSRQLWIQCNRLAVCRRGLLVLLFLRKDNPQAGEGRSIVRMVLSHGLPDLRSLRQFSLLFKCKSVSRSRRLRVRRARQQKRDNPQLQLRVSHVCKAWL